MNKVSSIFLAAAAVLAAGATEPSLEIVASSTNLVVTEQVSLSLSSARGKTRRSTVATWTPRSRSGRIPGAAFAALPSRSTTT